jgi:hypothetical protein
LESDLTGKKMSLDYIFLEQRDISNRIFKGTGSPFGLIIDV